VAERLKARVCKTLEETPSQVQILSCPYTKEVIMRDSKNYLFGTMNQFAVIHNPYQRNFDKVLFVCSAGLLRSPTAAHVFSKSPYNWNTRAVGCESYALTPITLPLIDWADQIYVMEEEHLRQIELTFGDRITGVKPKIHVLDIPDVYPYRDPELIPLLIEKVDAHQKSVSDEPEED
jgi:predicted protein tyrosine phosphatase